MWLRTGSFLKKLLFKVGNWAIVAMALVMILVVLMVVVDVTLRRAFNNPLGFSYELMGFGLVFVVWGSILYSTGRERHISVDVLVARFPERVRNFLRRAFDVVSSLVLLAIGWQSIVYALQQQRMHAESQILDIPIYPFIFVVAFGAIWAGLMLFVRFIDAVRGKEEL